MPALRDPIDPKLSLWHFLAYELRYEREKHGLSLTQMGQIIKAARSSVCNVEAGRRKIDEKQAKAIDEAWNTGRLFELLHWYARAAHKPDWFRQYSHYEATATSIKIYHGQAIPGPLQTDDYTRSLLQASRVKDIEAVLADRIARKRAILDRDDPPTIWALMDESVLAMSVGGPEVMKAQLQHLRDLTDLPHVIVRIIPTSSGAHLGIDGPFRVIGMETRDVAYAGAQNGGRLSEETAEVKELAVKFDHIGAQAASEVESRAIIDRYLERYT
ncbi:helix-turn-helix transcriptional regulator [Actinoallomurus purpureus]|uniref:helix-turn-helix domain-containing protein n=1 Tax=Actinoallomurus purpureus TaxID=478114 RepID=UPI002093EEE9|nr:helix-turn-helix transcriptional regulator [Actinoallomurus purpureus]MCO6009408.1 helix-turn-helix transcriptional regulator [Actinoallomurus purpureus]